MNKWPGIICIIAAILTILYATYTIGRVRGFQDCTDYVVGELKTRKTAGASGTADSTWGNWTDVDSLPVDSAGNPINPWAEK